MKEFGLMALISLVVLSAAYAVLAISLYRRARKHAAGLTCASVRQGDQIVHGCVCRDRGCAVPSADPGTSSHAEP